MADNNFPNLEQEEHEEIPNNILEENVIIITKDTKFPFFYPCTKTVIIKVDDEADLPTDIDFKGTYNGIDWEDCEFGETEESGWFPQEGHPGIFYALPMPNRPFMQCVKA